MSVGNDSIASLEKEIDELRKILRKKEKELSLLKECHVNKEKCLGINKLKLDDKLSKDDIERFSRQIIIPTIGVKGQQLLKAASVLIVGAGGLGCPAAQYLTGTGIGHIGLVDYDAVDRSNLHRQLLHTQENIGVSKVASAAGALKQLNSSIRISEHNIQLDSSNAIEIVQQYDIVIDATDNVATRYLLNDVCVISGKPLVSGSALRLEGQLTVYNFNQGPCYRCIFPSPPPPETVTNCGDGGVLGAVPGVIGVLQALEVIKIVLGWDGVLSGKLLLFSGEQSTFRNIRLRVKNPSCVICGDHPLITKLIDYEQFCGAKASDKDNAINILREEQRVSPEILHSSFMCNDEGILIDVRDTVEFKMCSLPNSINIPLKSIDETSSIQKIKEIVECKKKTHQNCPVYVLCRRGNDSQRAVLKLEKSLQEENVAVCDLKGGLHAWARAIDSSFPIY
ncbi:Adenylyltransferase and sulfurtransferase MOCS3 [Frankliniella fusca]|uniref:Adenylyltransferase and sulfurtransferase MOCS3 homolog n=1 Tax=Frankliniella fusca TaxID=407009 RepID=A0AAE1HT03_9NEOP|nr:Adenylyltransferase and sulfurtransferase MOCS3 [Frankliniella fusca]